MTKVIVDESMQLVLESTSGIVALCDKSGRTLGYFRSEVDKAEYEGIECPIDDQEVQRRILEGGGRTLSEMLADLEKRQ